MSSEIVTFTGRVVDPLRLRPEQVNIRDIAHSLANQCRFTGHVRTFYSVGQHSLLCTQLAQETRATRAQQFHVLMHDASEAYLSDLARPVKHAAGLGPIYREIEDAIQAVISERYGLTYPFPEYVHKFDNALLKAEQRDLMPRHRHIDSVLTYEHPITAWGSGAAERPFLELFEELSGEAARR